MFAPQLITSLVLAAAALIGSAEVAAADVSTPPASFFGMHYSAVAEGTWPQADVGSVRLWDTGTSWRDLQPERGMWDWSRLDAAVDNAHAHGASVDLVLGPTPVWASARPTEMHYLLGGGAEPAQLDDWWVYVHAVADRYRGRIASYEVWNEPDWSFSGSPATLALMARTARDAVRSADPTALMVSPSPVLRLGSAWMSAYAAAGGYRWADVVGVHSYPARGEDPEQGIARTERARALLVALGVRRPIWDTETNLETNTGGRLDRREQAAYVARFYLLAWTHGVSRVNWYDWNASPNLGVRMAAANGSTSASRAGLAFTRVRLWMRGRSQPCTIGRAGTYHCAFTRGRAHGVVLWNPTRHASPTVDARWAENLLGHRWNVTRHRVTVGGSPVYVRL